ncbi:hypothetical protein R5R35_004006 [Gryllus longicercus]|uniref:Uncharacterized protein n=1 Tax=Gryllus longicercus TaxID=2509291 RepID=A0AAN9YYS7_9ORTH
MKTSEYICRCISKFYDCPSKFN